MVDHQIRSGEKHAAQTRHILRKVCVPHDWNILPIGIAFDQAIGRNVRFVEDELFVRDRHRDGVVDADGQVARELSVTH
jgi:hypothetical protein